MYLYHGTGCCGHVVWDDHNLEDVTIRRCQEIANSRDHLLCAAALDALLQVSYEERRSLFWLRCTVPTFPMMNGFSLIELPRNSVVTFDFDDTLLWTQVVRDADGEIEDTLEWGLNPFAALKLRQATRLGLRVFIVTTRHRDMHSHNLMSWLTQWDMGNLFEGIIFTNGEDKTRFLRDLGSRVHFDDDIVELDQLPEGCQGVMSNIHPSWGPSPQTSENI